MKARAYFLRFKSPVTRMPRAPALFGQLVWAERWFLGASGVRRLLEAFTEGSPPFLLSSAFPVAQRGPERLPLLPCPKLPPVLVKDSRKRKALKRARYLTFELFQQVAEGGEKRLAGLLEDDAQTLVEGALVPRGSRLRMVSEARTRVGIDRVAGTHAPGVLFSETALRLEEAVVYATFAPGEYGPEWFEARLHEVGRQGFGGKKSIGYGAFEVEDGGELELPEASGATAYTLLAPVLPPDGEGWYAIEPYWGRLGEHYALAQNPFKRVHYRAVEGSTFKTPPAGVLLEVTPEPPPEEGVQIYEYLYPFALGVRA